MHNNACGHITAAPKSHVNLAIPIKLPVMPASKMLVYLVSLLAVACGQQSHAGLRLQLTKRGLQYTNGVLEGLMVQQLKQARFGSFTKQLTLGSVTVADTRLTDFDNAAADYTIDAANNQVIINTHSDVTSTPTELRCLASGL